MGVNLAVYFSPVLPVARPNLSVFEDPRVPGFGYRIIGRKSGEREIGTMDEYIKRRLEWGIGEGDKELSNLVPMHVNGDLMNGIDFEKGWSNCIAIVKS
jgi:hypothetical protein